MTPRHRNRADADSWTLKSPFGQKQAMANGRFRRSQLALNRAKCCHDQAGKV